MNDEEEVVISNEEQQEQPEQRQQKPRKTVGETIDETRQKVENVGKTVENVGKVEEKAADFIDGGEKATKAATNVGSATSSVAEKGTDAAKKAAELREKGAEAAEKTAKASKEAAKAGKESAKAGKAASQAVSTAADAERAASQAAASIPYAGAPISAAGQTIAGIQKGAAETGKAAATAAEAGATAAEATAASAEAAAKAAKNEAKAEIAAAKAANTSAKATKAGNELGKKASDKTFADKLRERGKLNQARGKRLQELSKKFDSKEFFDDTFEKIGDIGKVLKGIIKLFDPKTIMVIVLLLIIGGTLLVSYVLSPMFFMKLLNDTVANPDKVEMVNNYISGLGFQNSQDAFYEEVNYLNTRYDENIDFPYIMSTVYYTDIYYGDTGYYTNDIDKVCEFFDLEDDNQRKACNLLQVGISIGKMWTKEATTTTGDDGLIYSANKIYRLRDLAKHQFLGDKTVETTTLDEYIKDCVKKVDNETKQIIEYLPLLIAYAIAHVNPILGPAFDTVMANSKNGQFLSDLVEIFKGTESWKSIEIYFEEGKYDTGFIDSLENFVTTFFDCIFNIKSIYFDGDITSINVYDPSSIASLFKVDYYEFSYNEEKFEEYLVKEYIPNMPEFSKLLKDSNGNKLKGDALDKQVNQIAYEIKMAKELFDNIYQMDESAQEDGICIGDIDLDLLRELTPPVSLTIGQTITFYGSNNYGLQKGVIHNGVDLDEDSTNTKQGDDVFSIYDGKVVSSTVDGTFEDPNVKGGWVAIDYIVQYSDSTKSEGSISKLFKYKLSKIRVYYGGIDASTLTLKKGDIVSKGQVIGKVGDKTISETGEKPSLHFAIYDRKRSTFLNPVNMFITCSYDGGINACDNSGGLVIELPDSVLQLSQNNYTVTCYNKTGWVYSTNKGKTCTNEKAVAKSSLQRKVHDIWKENGAKYKNSIAVLTVNGVERYLVAVTEKFGKSGDLIDATLENGETIKMVIADIKSYEHTGVTDAKLCKNSSISDPGCYGHIDGKKLSVLEFEYDPNTYNSGKINPSSLDQEWDTSQKVKSITRYGSILGDSYSDTTCGEQNDTTTYTNSSSTDSSEKSRSNSCNDYTSKGKDACNNGSTSTNKCTWVAIPGGDKGYCKDGEKIKRKCTEYGLNKGFTCPKVDDYGDACIDTAPSGNSKPGCGYNENAKKCEDLTTKGISGCSGKTDDYGNKCEWNGSKCFAK